MGNWLRKLEMRIFSIGEINFGVDLDKSKLALNTRADGKRELNADIYGDAGVFRQLSGQEDVDWSWALYPPVFFLHGFVVTDDEDGAAPETLRFEAAPTEYEIAIYMMEYSDLSDVCIVELSKERFEIQGNVDLLGNTLPFKIVIPLA
jgi:hypothetical protein